MEGRHGEGGMTMEHEDFEGGARGGHGRRMVGGCWNKCKNWQEIG